MQVYVDASPVADERVADGTVADALRQVQSAYCAPGRMVVRVRCDGHDVLSDAMESTLQRRAASVARLEVFTATRTALIMDAMKQASNSLQGTEDACRRVAEMLTEGKVREAMETLGDCLRAWQQIHLAVTKSIAMLQLDVERMTLQDQPLVELLARPKEVLLQVRDALSNQDHVLLADLLQYEFSDVTDQWYALIARVREEAEGQSPA